MKPRFLILLLATAATAFAQRVMLDPAKLVQSTLWAVASGSVTNAEATKSEQEKKKQQANEDLMAAWGDKAEVAGSKPIELSGMTAEERASRMALIDTMKNSDAPAIVALRESYKQEDEWQKALAVFAARVREIEERNGERLSFNERLALENEMGVHKNQSLLLAINSQQADADKLARLRAEKALMREEEMRREEMSAALYRAIQTND